jgi:hypothetical protein
MVNRRGGGVIGCRMARLAHFDVLRNHDGSVMKDA